jgi:Protein of unknown function (DUF2868)
VLHLIDESADINVTFDDALVTESIRNLEEHGALDDAQAMRRAVAEASDRQAQVGVRARHLGQRLELPSRLTRARALAPFVLLALALLIALFGAALAGQVMDTVDRRINVMAALAALLGLHWLTLLAWLLALCLPQRLAGAGNALGHLWLSLTARLTLGRGGEAAVLPRALVGLLERARLLPWVLGLASHLIWVLSFAVVLAALLFALAFRSYTLTWETTILSSETFVSAVHWLGVVPGWLGFPTPDANTVVAPVAGASGQRVWALWLLGCVTVYGLLPRLACAAWCALMFRSRRARLLPDYGLPYYRKLFARLDAMAPAVIVDPDPGLATGAASSTASGQYCGSTAPMVAVVAFELPPEMSWPPATLDRSAVLQLRADGSAGQRREVLDALARAHPRLSVVACAAASSPDRGTARMIRDILASSGQCRVLLMASGGAAGLPVIADSLVARWREWLATSQLQVECFTDWQQASRLEPT